MLFSQLHDHFLQRDASSHSIPVQYSNFVIWVFEIGFFFFSNSYRHGTGKQSLIKTFLDEKGRKSLLYTNFLCEKV